MKHFDYFKNYVRRYSTYFWGGLALLVLTDILDIIPPLIIMRAVDQITTHAGVNALLHTALIFTGVTILLAGVRFQWRMQFGKFHHNVARDLRERIFKKFTEL